MSDLAERYFEKALTAIRGHANQRALDLLVEAIKLKPNFAEAWIVRGNVLHSIEQHFNALLHYDRALTINDKLHDAWNNRGLAFGDLGMFESAEHCFRESAKICPAIEPHMGLANMFCTVMKLEEAADEYRAALAIDPGLCDARFNLGVTLLGLGRWEEGFREYEARWANTPYPPRSYRNYKKWQGEDLSGKRILLYPEQGYGDEIMALRFAESVQARWSDATVIVQARTPMLRLARLSNQIRSIAVMPMHGDEHENIPIDFSCPLLDVPMILGLTPQTIWRPRRYLGAQLTDVQNWCERLGQLPPGLNVGLCWSAGTHLNTARASAAAKSIHLPLLAPLAMPGVNLISLQKERSAWPTGPEPFAIQDWMDDCHDFADTAALIESLDLVISVDTAVAHLAGALGKPVWNFVRYSGYWPWLAPDVAPDLEHSIWYPSMKLIRQARIGDWSEPIARVTRWLGGEAQRRAA